MLLSPDLVWIKTLCRPSPRIIYFHFCNAEKYPIIIVFRTSPVNKNKIKYHFLFSPTFIQFERLLFGLKHREHDLWTWRSLWMAFTAFIVSTYIFPSLFHLIHNASIIYCKKISRYCFCITHSCSSISFVFKKPGVVLHFFNVTFIEKNDQNY